MVCVYAVPVTQPHHTPPPGSSRPTTVLIVPSGAIRRIAQTSATSSEPSGVTVQSRGPAAFASTAGPPHANRLGSGHLLLGGALPCAWVRVRAENDLAVAGLSHCLTRPGEA